MAQTPQYMADLFLLYPFHFDSLVIWTELTDSLQKPQWWCVPFTLVRSGFSAGNGVTFQWTQLSFWGRRTSWPVVSFVSPQLLLTAHCMIVSLWKHTNKMCTGRYCTVLHSVVRLFSDTQTRPSGEQTVSCTAFSQCWWRGVNGLQNQVSPTFQTEILTAGCISDDAVSPELRKSNVWAISKWAWSQEVLFKLLLPNFGILSPHLFNLYVPVIFIANSWRRFYLDWSPSIVLLSLMGLFHLQASVNVC